LTKGEIGLVERMFGASVNTALVTINARTWWPLQPKTVVMAPDGHIWCHPKGGLFCDDYSAAPLALQALFIHEMTHVWQHQSGIFLPLRRHPFCRYAYTLQAGKPLRAYGLEQQAEILAHAYLALAGGGTPDRDSPWREAAAESRGRD
jgi:hypothetical protein